MDLIVMLLEESWWFVNCKDSNRLLGAARYTYDSR